MGLELAEQLDWELPDVILYQPEVGPADWNVKAFNELEAIDWIGSKRPRMVAVQAEGCAPIVKAYDDGAKLADPWPDAHTIAAGIRVPAAIGDFLILEAVRESGGSLLLFPTRPFAMRTSTARGLRRAALSEGAATLAALRQELGSGRIKADEKVVLFNCATGLKYPMPGDHRRIDLGEAIDYDFILSD